MAFPKYSQLHETLDQFNPLHLFLFLFSFFALYMRLIRGDQRKKKLNLPPSPPQLPIIGNLHQLGTLVHQSFTALSKKYGPLMLLKLGQTQYLIVSSADMAKQVMKTHDAAFSNRPQTTQAIIFGYDGKSIGLSSYGDYWRRVRRVSVHELLNVKRVNMFHNVREDEAQILVQRLRDASLSGETVNLTDLMIVSGDNVISRCIFGKKFDRDEDGKSKNGELSREMQVRLQAFFYADYFPFLSWVDRYVRGPVRQLQKTHEEFDAFFDQMIREHKVKRSSDQYDYQSDDKDFMDILLQLQKEGNLDFELTNDNIKAVLTDMYLAGGDSSPTTLEWTMTELIRNPIKMKKVQEEVRRVWGKKTKLDSNDVNEMHYLECVIKESLRLHPSGPPMIHRETTTTIRNMGGYDIPAKTRVFINIYGIQRDPKVWENPDEFIPERFLEKEIDFQSQDTFKFLPFGGGRRGCPGVIFAITAVKYFMAHLLYWFDWKLADESMIPEELEVEETNGIIVPKKNHLHLKPILYSP